MLQYRFCFVLFCIWGHFPISSPRGHIRKGDLTEGFVGYELGGLYMEGLIFGILRYIGEPRRCKLISPLKHQEHNHWYISEKVKETLKKDFIGIKEIEGKLKITIANYSGHYAPVYWQQF